MEATLALRATDFKMPLRSDLHLAESSGPRCGTGKAMCVCVCVTEEEGCWLVLLGLVAVFNSRPYFISASFKQKLHVDTICWPTTGNECLCAH